MVRKFLKALIVLCAIPAILLVLAVGKGLAAQHTPELPASVPAMQTDPLPAAQLAASQAQQPWLSQLREEKLCGKAALSLSDDLQVHFGGGRIVNILLIGQDAQSDSGARSDTMILCTFNKEEDTITMTSFLRDLYVSIPGYKNNRINAAYRFGGTKLLTQTLYENFGVRVDGSVLVDFDCFEKIIDSLGGIPMELTAAEADFINDHVQGSELAEGKQLLTGRQALLHARNRYDTDGDFSRTNRQRKLLSALLEGCRSKKLPDILELLQQMRPMITTDISKSDLTVYALTLFPMLAGAEIRTQAIPAEGAYSYKTIDGKAVLLPDIQKNIEVLQDTLF